jgi:hypothetical protein
MTTDYETEVVVDGNPYAVACELELEVIDDGIGGYEYWGSKGTDHNYVWDLIDYSYDAYDADGNEITDLVLKVKVGIEVEKRIFRYIAELPVEKESDDSEEDTY